MPTDLPISDNPVQDKSTLDTEDILSVDDLHIQIKNLTQMQKDNPDMDIPMGTIEECLSAANATLGTIDSSDESGLCAFAYDIHSLAVVFETSIRKGMKDVTTEDAYKTYREILPKRFPNNYADRDNLAQLECRALDQVPFNDLLPSEQDRYIRLLANINKQYYSNYSGGCYWFGYGFAEHTPGADLLENIMQNPNVRLTPEEESIVYEDERNTFKIHLKVPPERKIEVLKAILSAKKEDSRIVNQLYETRQKNGDPNPHFTDFELVQAGCKAHYISKYKMAGQSQNPNNVADFIFYSYENSDNSAEEITKQIAHDLNEILAPLNLPQSENLSRYSAPVIMNGQRVPGMSFTQGNGDFKDYLRRVHPESLDRFYDRNRNWALRPGAPFSFDN